MDRVLNLYKNAGETPLECILRYKNNHPEFKDVSMTYAGRLDPLAEGVLLVLTGEMVHKKEEFLNLKKEYEVEILFGFETDTFDVLGLCSKFERHQVIEFDVKNSLKNFVGKNIFEYPPYSSKPINGKPLFSLARGGELEDVEMPKREVEIFNLKVLNWREINSKDLLHDIEEKINMVKGDFRQEDIVAKWREVLSGKNLEFQIVKISAEVSSGTYMRTLAHELGKKLHVPALAFHIIRTKVGEYCIEKGL